MTAEKKFKTFADLRLIPNSDDKYQKQDSGFSQITQNLIEKEIGATSISSSTSTPNKLKQKNNINENTSEAVAPIKDFQKVPNSVTREVLSAGLFKGKSKQVYDYLYSITRGAITPTRTTRKSRKEIQKGSGIGSMVTVDAALAHLESIELIKIRSAVGSLSGNEYEILTPEEALSDPPRARISTTSSPSTSSISRSSSPIQILDDLDQPLSSISSITQVIDNKDTYAGSKTFFKTIEEKAIDDEPAAAFRIFAEKLNQGFKGITGREATDSDEQKLAQLGELLAAELMEAASRTKVVSDPAAFLLTHLRRRLGVRSIKVETIREKEMEKGTTLAKPLKKEIQLTDDEIQECPDCNGRLLIYPEGLGKGAIMCKHQQLTKVKQEASKKERK
ncbi:MAG TPA: hypothetical protein VF648_12855 [Pyrinomonadaceae bacterium]